MPRSKEGKTREKINPQALECAVNDILKGKCKLNEAARRYSLSRSTVSRHYKNYLSLGINDQTPFVYDAGKNAVRKVFTNDQELKLVSYLKQLAAVHYGLTKKDILKQTFEYAKVLSEQPDCKIQVPKEWVTAESAGEFWLRLFKKRHPDLSLCKPKPTSLSRTTNFNKENYLIMDIQIVKQEIMEIEIKEEDVSFEFVDKRIKQEVSTELIGETIPSSNGDNEDSMLNREIKEESNERGDPNGVEEMKKIEFDFVKVETDWNLSEESEPDSLALYPAEYESHNTEDGNITTASTNPALSQNIGNASTRLDGNTNSNLHKCPECDYCLATQSNLRRHIMRIHTSERPFKCLHCDYSSATRASLSAHIRAHREERPFSCAHCNYSSFTQHDLNKHKKIHINVKPYKCAHCDYCSVFNKNLKRHVMRVHVGKRHYNCSDCDYSSFTQNELKMHISRIHIGEKPYKCAQCDFCSTLKKNLKMHIMRVHGRERHFSCTYCDYSFFTQNELKVHIMRIHTAEKPHKCSHCNFCSATQNNLKKHIIRKHATEKVDKPDVVYNS